MTEIIPDEPLKECPVCKDLTLFRYDECDNCGFDISDTEPTDPSEVFTGGDYEY